MNKRQLSYTKMLVSHRLLAFYSECVISQKWGVVYVHRSVYASAFMYRLILGLLCQVVNTHHLVLSRWLHPCGAAIAEVITLIYYVYMYVCIFLS